MLFSILLACIQDPTTYKRPIDPKDITAKEPQHITETKAEIEIPKPKNEFAFPTESELASNPNKEQILRGKELLTDTYKQLPENVGAKMNCTNCHLQGGTVPNAMTFVGVEDRYPKYRTRTGKEDNLAERINGCFDRSMNGTPLAEDSAEMKAMLAYMEWISSDIEDGKELKEAGLQKLEALTPDPENGEALYVQKCASCHQATGEGFHTPDGQVIYPPLWGEDSFNIGAGMARLHKAAAFIKWNMPLGQGGTLTDQESYDIAAYFTVQDRPDLKKKDKDWPKGDKPSDARY